MSSGIIENVEAMASMHHDRKTWCDPVHGQITVHPLCNRIIDTPQFQRLRYIRQLGFGDYVYPGAVHDRFGHSIGVSYIAGYFLRHLRSEQPSLNITNEEILSVEIAGLCHDLGHGPYSHSWEVFMNKEMKNRGYGLCFKHEAISVNMFDYLIIENGLETEFLKWNITGTHIQMIKDMVSGNTCGNEARAFLYQVVNNDISGLDVDKWDYFLRDSYYCGITTSFDFKRLVLFAKVNFVDGMNQICFRDKEAGTILNMFRTRHSLHDNVYSHRVSRLIEHLFCETLHLSLNYLRFGPEQQLGDVWKWSIDAAKPRDETTEILFLKRMEKFCTLTDLSIINAIYNSSGDFKELQDARKILQSFRIGRSFKNDYRWIGRVFMNDQATEEQISDNIFKHAPPSLLNGGCEQFQKNLLVLVSTCHYGKFEKNPVSFVHFYSKGKVDQGVKYNSNELHLDLPKAFLKTKIMVYARDCDEEQINILKDCFNAFQENVLKGSTQ